MDTTRRAFIGSAAAGVAGVLAARSIPGVRAQINTIHSLFIAHEDKFAVTPNYHVFAMYQAHQGAQALRTVFSSPSIAYAREGQARALWGLAGSASRRHRTLTATTGQPQATAARAGAIAR